MESYDPGETLRVFGDATGMLRVHHGATEVATIKDALGGAVRIEADGRRWRLERTGKGWEATGEPGAALRHRALRGDVLTIGADEYRVNRRGVKGLVRFRVDKKGRRPELRGEILAAPRSDGHATIALATAAVVLGADLSPTGAHSAINGDNRSAASQYGLGH